MMTSEFSLLLTIEVLTSPGKHWGFCILPRWKGLLIGRSILLAAKITSTSPAHVHKDLIVTFDAWASGTWLIIAKMPRCHYHIAIREIRFVGFGFTLQTSSQFELPQPSCRKLAFETLDFLRFLGWSAPFIRLGFSSRCLWECCCFCCFESRGREKFKCARVGDGRKADETGKEGSTARFLFELSSLYVALPLPSTKIKIAISN